MTVFLLALQAATLGATNYAVDAPMAAPAGKRPQPDGLAEQREAILCP
jgi:hypothetical protein